MESRAQNRLMDDCIELDSYIKPSTLHGIHKINGEDPETVTFGETFKTSKICEFQ